MASFASAPPVSGKARQAKPQHRGRHQHQPHAAGAGQRRQADAEEQPAFHQRVVRRIEGNDSTRSACGVPSPMPNTAAMTPIWLMLE